MNTLVIVLIAAVVLFGAYVFYGRWLANKWGSDPKAKTPAYTKEDGKDYVTLVTCTPYGINSHRLLVRGIRVPYVEAEKEQQVSRQEESTWNQEYLHAIIVGVEWTAVGIGVVLVLTGLYRLLFKSKKGGGKA